ncbi:glycoside hydrolase family protein [Pseudoalteromonas sp. S16_S37]|uniref:glycoside hydrolase family protein n=1 Tax=Pseudoalteromonas sp. S16_S37 TaxID=2720228 RepID=UPI00168026E6|nr:glycoside hydrolase family protein [Pseudoalteromonas sp. S16_S37]MBD1583133.1 glycoside hydrolase family protein [Pseudoalteromonas sp. S16_S37]
MAVLTEQGLQTLKEQLLRYEGLSLTPYQCTQGKITIGIGRNLTDRGITLEEAHFLLSNDIKDVQLQVSSNISIFEALNETRKLILLDMAFNLGVAGLCKFKKMIAALERQDYDVAAREMLDSKWAKQVGRRAQELAAKMIEG